MKEMETKEYIFGALFVVSNILETRLERGLKEFHITAKQWFLGIVLRNLFKEPPTIRQTAKVMGSSHQNVKQIALLLEKKGLLEQIKNPLDKREVRLKLTEHSYQLWEDVRVRGGEFRNELFDEIEKKDLEVTKKVLQKLLQNMQTMQNIQDKKKEESL